MSNITADELVALADSLGCNERETDQARGVMKVFYNGRVARSILAHTSEEQATWTWDVKNRVLTRQAAAGQGADEIMAGTGVENASLAASWMQTDGHGRPYKKQLVAQTIKIGAIYCPVIEPREGLRQHILALSRVKPVLHTMTWDPAHEEAGEYMRYLTKNACGVKKIEAKPGTLSLNETVQAIFPTTIRAHYREGGHPRWEVKPKV